MRRRERYVCWDLDETLGSFRDYGKMQLTRGIAPLIERLSARDIGHVVTTAASREHAEYVLSHFGMRDYFEHVFDISMICDQNYNKYYCPVAGLLGIVPQEAPHRMLVVGNLIRDSPSDLDLVFMYRPDGHIFPASLVGDVLELMAGGKSWAEYFEWLSNAGKTVRNGVFCGSVSADLMAGRARFHKPQPPPGTRLLSHVWFDEKYEENEIKNAA